MDRATSPNRTARPRHDRALRRVEIVRAADLQLTESDLARAAGAFAVGTLTSIGGFENALFRSGDGRIVRITHTSRRSVNQVEAEFSFMEHLASHGVATVAPIPTTDGRLVAELVTGAGDAVVAVCMTEAPGARLAAPLWSDVDIQAYGELLGAMHTASRSFEPQGRGRRPDWTDPIFDVGIASLADSHPDLHRRFHEIVAAGASCPAGTTDLLIHQDVHLGNLFVTEDGVITVFDFDDCAYGTAVHDIAIPLFYWVLGTEAEPAGEAARFLKSFLAGYRRHAALAPGWAEDADRFLSYREVDIYWLVADEPDDESSEAELRFMEGRLQRILEGVPYLGVPLADVIDG